VKEGNRREAKALVQGAFGKSKPATSLTPAHCDVCNRLIVHGKQAYCTVALCEVDAQGLADEVALHHVCAFCVGESYELSRMTRGNIDGQSPC